MRKEAEIDCLHVDILAHIFFLLATFKDSALASGVCKKWKRVVEQSLAWRSRMSFASLNMDDESTSRLVLQAYNLTELDISRSRWGCQISDNGLFKISCAKCLNNLTSISLWGVTGVTDAGVICLLKSLQHLNLGGTFITDDSLIAISNSCPHLKSIGLWSCRQVSEEGLIILVRKCRKLESMNVWGTRVPRECFNGLVAISPTLEIKQKGLLLNIQRAPFSTLPSHF
ncbi:F-box protein At5g67140-like [Impatiens glandulifera]|uniref:F-box protein At5g67140-like n=1 Tax=Impatiens glandulifera TaxID=253017 RepID=UPI001FB0E290|nr:F-box protein At5g67140-like [Impatiens glandulifera]